MTIIIKLFSSLMEIVPSRGAIAIALWSVTADIKRFAVELTWNILP